MRAEKGPVNCSGHGYSISRHGCGLGPGVPDPRSLHLLNHVRAGSGGVCSIPQQWMWAGWASLLYLPGQKLGQVRLGQDPTGVCEICHWEVTDGGPWGLLCQDTVPACEYKNQGWEQPRLGQATVPRGIHAAQI